MRVIWLGRFGCLMVGLVGSWCWALVISVVWVWFRCLGWLLAGLACLFGFAFHAGLYDALQVFVLLVVSAGLFADCGWRVEICVCL